MRKLATIVASTVLLAAVAAALTGCTSANATIAGCTPTKSGADSNAVTVSDNFGKTPTVKIKSPVAKIKTTQRTLIKAGTGKVATKSSRITADFAVYNGTTG